MGVPNLQTNIYTPPSKQRLTPPTFFGHEFVTPPPFFSHEFVTYPGRVRGGFARSECRARARPPPKKKNPQVVRSTGGTTRSTGGIIVQEVEAYRVP